MWTRQLIFRYHQSCLALPAHLPVAGRLDDQLAYVELWTDHTRATFAARVIYGDRA